MNLTATVVASLLLVVGQAESEPSTSRLGNFVVAPIYDVRVPSREPGALLALDARKGDVVEEGQVLGRVDDSDAQIRRIIAENELKAAQAQAESDADLKAAVATVGVAKAEWEGSEEIRSVSKGAISEFQVRRDKLTYERSQYQADTAQVEHQVAQITLGMKTAQLQAVDNELRRRQIVAPITGVIADRFHNIGEWAQAGEPIYRVVHMDRLRVEGMLNASYLTPAEIAARPQVTIFVKTPDGKEVQKVAEIDFISQVVDHSGEFLISAEFDNGRTVQDPAVQWEVRPGLEAEAVLHPELMSLYEQRMKSERQRSFRSGAGSVRNPLDFERIQAARDRNQ